MDDETTLYLIIKKKFITYGNSSFIQDNILLISNILSASENKNDFYSDLTLRPKNYTKFSVVLNNEYVNNHI